MKNKLILSFFVTSILCLLSPKLSAQVSYGLKSGITMPTQVTSNDEIESKSFVGFYGGGFININLGRNFSLQPELQFQVLGSNLLGQNDESIKTRISYLTIPLLLQYEITKGLKLEIGGQAAFPLNGSVKQFGNTLLEWNRDLDAGILGGISYEFPNSGWSVDLRYYRGLISQSPGKQASKLYNRSLNLGVGYTFRR